jgi:U3 small nucleolar RNA-associated protein 15
LTLLEVTTVSFSTDLKLYNNKSLNFSNMSSTTIVTASSTTNTFKTALSLQTPKPTTASVTAGLIAPEKAVAGADDVFVESDPNEARYWMQKFGLGSHKYSTALKKFAHPRKLLLKPTEGTAIVQQLLFGPAATEANSKHSPLAVVGGPRVHLYGTNAVSTFSRHLARHSLNAAKSTDLTTEVAADRQVQMGGHLAFCASFRNDGRLLAVGTDVGEVRVADVTMRATLCTFVTPSTKLPIRTVAWFRNGKHVLSGGDDGVLRIWNLSSQGGTSIGLGGAANASGGAMLDLVGHGDSIRCACLWQAPKVGQAAAAAATKPKASVAWSQLAFSGSYDHTVRVWNVQDPEQAGNEDRCLAVLSHGVPVETLLTMSSTDPNVPVWLLSAGGMTIKVWNPLSGECVSTVKTQHRKTITTLLPILRPHKGDDGKTDAALPSWRILTGSLDGYIRIHQWSSRTGQLLHIHGLKVGEGEPITALAANEGGDRIAIGTTAGTVLVRQKGPSITQSKRKREPRAGTYAFFTRGMNVSVDADTASANNDYLAGSGQPKKKKLRKYDLCLKQFRYGDALDEALETRIPSVVVAVLEELGKRRALTIALSHRDEESLEPVLAFMVRYVTRPRFMSILIGVAHKIIDIYGDIAGQSETIDELFVKLKTSIRNECRAQKSLLRLIGQLDAIMAPDVVNELQE